jgi:methionine-rich copper-binding protein CopC
VLYDQAELGRGSFADHTIPVGKAMMKHPLLGMILTTAIILGLSSAANARLENHQTHDSSRVTGANLILAFSQPVDLKITKVEIRNSSGALVEIGELQTAANGTDLEIPLSAPLPADVYTIHWRAVSIHGLVDEGGYGFQVEPSFNRIPTLALQ